MRHPILSHASPVKTNPVLIRKIFAVSSVLFGVGWSWAAIYPPLRHILARDREAFDCLSILVVVPFMVIPGALAVGAGIDLYRTINLGALKCALGTFAFLGALSISTALTAAFPNYLAEQNQRMLSLLFGTLVVIPLYVVVVKKLLEMLGQKRPGICELLGRGTLGLVAWQVWLLLSGVFREYSPLEDGEKYLHKAPWETLGLLVPIIVAYGGYKFAVRLLPAQATRRTIRTAIHRRTESNVAGSTDSVSEEIS